MVHTNTEVINWPDNVKILVGIPTAEMARRADFYDYVNMLEMPVGTIRTNAHGQSPARNRNIMIEQALEHNCTHILFLDDDLAFQPTLLYDLLKHDKDVVTGLYLMRSYPHQPIIFDFTQEDGRCRHYYPADDEHGLLEIVACGLGAVLINMNVFRALEKPYVRLGELEKDHWCDDIGLWQRVRAAGFKLYCDLDVHVGHMFSGVVWPSKINGKWNTVYETNGSGVVNFPSLKPLQVKNETINPSQSELITV